MLEVFGLFWFDFGVIFIIIRALCDKCRIYFANAELSNAMESMLVHHEANDLKLHLHRPHCLFRQHCTIQTETVEQKSPHICESKDKLYKAWNIWVAQMERNSSDFISFQKCDNAWCQKEPDKNIYWSIQGKYSITYSLSPQRPNSILKFAGYRLSVNERLNSSILHGLLNPSSEHAHKFKNSNVVNKPTTIWWK